ncbi:hypothetical protein [Novosphingobium rosa]|uniref:hypothetical protein n=1 Tax=Novosphingobium rosa TaxID=76978 RepID=UPI00082F509A|nr:hypothetical protein [Novosphingobium rosa]
MYQFLDRKLDELDAASLFLLREIREWVSSVQAGRCPCRTTARNFATVGLESIAEDFGMALFTLNSDGLQQLQLAKPGCLAVRDDEARLLALFQSAADGDGYRLQQLAATLVEEPAMARLMQSVSVTAAHIAATHVSTRFD